MRAGGRVAERVHVRTAVLIDAVLGTGAKGSWDPDVIPEVSPGVTVVACDLPTGVNAGTGQIAGGVIPAGLTVTFGALKAGLFVGAGAQAAADGPFEASALAPAVRAVLVHREQPPRID